MSSTNFSEQLNAILSGKYPWWLWPSFLFSMGVFSVVAAFVFYPEPSGDPDWVWIAGMQFGGECGMKVALDMPCPQCGMTRSWVYLVRGRIMEAFTFNSAGALLLLWLIAGGVIGFVRLVTGRERALTLPFPVTVALIVAWTVVPYLGFWIARIAGWNMLPEYF